MMMKRLVMGFTRFVSTRAPSPSVADSRVVKIGLIAGDGIGEQLVISARKVLENAPILDVELEFVEVDNVGFAEFERSGTTVPSDAIKALRGCQGAIFGAVCSPSGHVPGYVSPIVELRKQLDLFVNLRPLRQPAARIDALVVRENTEDLYVGVERLEDDGALAVAERHISRRNSARAARVACEQALERARVRDEEEALVAARDGGAAAGTGAAASSRAHSKKPQVVCLHKANILGVTDALWLDSCKAVARRAPFAKTVEFTQCLVDIALHDLILDPSQFDVLLCPNFYGDLIQDAGAALCGGLGVTPTANVGNQFMLCHGSLVVSPSLEPDDFANPLGHIRSAGMLMNHLGEHMAAIAIEDGVQQVLKSGPKTKDLGGSATTKEVRHAVIDAVEYSHLAEMVSQGS